MSLQNVLQTISVKYDGLPMLSFVDNNSCGLKICSVFNDGSKGLYCENEHLAARRIQHVSLLMEEVEVCILFAFIQDPIKFTSSLLDLKSLTNYT